MTMPCYIDADGIEGAVKPGVEQRIGCRSAARLSILFVINVQSLPADAAEIAVNQATSKLRFL